MSIVEMVEEVTAKYGQEKMLAMAQEINRRE